MKKLVDLGSHCAENPNVETVTEDMRRKRLPDPMLTLEEVAQILSCSYSKVYRLAREGGIPGGMQIGAEWRFDRTIFERWRQDQIRSRD